MMDIGRGRMISGVEKVKGLATNIASPFQVAAKVQCHAQPSSLINPGDEILLLVKLGRARMKARELNF